MGLDITDAALGAFRVRGGDGTVVLVNLIRLREGGGPAYHAYLEAIAPLFARVGAELIWAGASDGAEPLIGDERYDHVAVVRYPSRAAVAALVEDPEFATTAPLRHAALEAGILHAFHD